MLVLAAKVWHYWIAVPIAVLVIVAGLATAVGYVVKVVRPKYPPRDGS